MGPTWLESVFSPVVSKKFDDSVLVDDVNSGVAGTLKVLYICIVRCYICLVTLHIPPYTTTFRV